MSEVYGTTGSIPGDQTTIRGGGALSISVAFATDVGLVGGMDTANGSATEGEVTTVNSSAEGEDAFGADSELSEQISLALQNGAGEVHAVGVSETETTESFATSAQGTLTNVPLFDIRLHEDHSIDVTDTAEGASVTVNMVDASPPTQPTNANTININPNTGEFYADESSDYDITYTYGDYESAIDEVLVPEPRFIGVMTENTTVANYLLTQLNTYDTDFNFMHGVVGAGVDITPSSYSDAFDDRRLSVVAPSRAWIDSAETDMARTVGAVAGKQSGKALGDTTTFESLDGFSSLYKAFTNSQLGTLLDAGVYPLRQRGGIQVIKDRTTSTDVRFARIAHSEIVDEATEISHQISQNFIGKANIPENRTSLQSSHVTSYREMQSDNLLDAFYVSVTEGASANEVSVDIGLDVVNYMDTIDVTITVGDVVVNEGTV